MDTDDAGFVLLRTRPSLQTPTFQSPSRSPSRSPRTDSAARELDPLLANLSPISTLEALQVTDAVSPENSELTKSIAHASDTERAFGIRAALAAKKLKEWRAEVEEWYWPEKKFEPPSAEEASSWNEQTSPTAPSYFFVGGGGTSEFCGSMPERIVRQLEERIDDIKDDMEALDVEELKDHVRGAHLPTHGKASYNYLDDFTMVITAIIMQALPHMARLTILLDVWSIRLVALREVPIFLHLLDEADTAVASAWETLQRDIDSTMSDFAFNRNTFNTMRESLGDHITKLAQNLDSILDTLEGHRDRFPDRWIDEMEKVQEQYEDWVVAAERQAELNEWESQHDETTKASTAKVDEQQILSDVDGHVWKSSERDLSSGTSNNHEPKTDNAEVILDKYEPSQREHDKDRGFSDANVRDYSNDDPSADVLEPLSINPQPVHTTGQNNDSMKGRPVSPSVEVSSASDTLNDPANIGPKAEPSQPTDQTLSSTMGNCSSFTGSIWRKPSQNGDTSTSGRQQDVTETQPFPSYFDTFDLQRPSQSHRDPQLTSESNEPTPMQNSMHSPPHRPTNLNLHGANRMSSDLDAPSEPSSASSASFSDISDAQIMDAAPIQFYKSPVEEKFSPWNKNLEDASMSRRSSQKTETGSQVTIDPISRNNVKHRAGTRSRSSSLAYEISDIGYDYLPAHGKESLPHRPIVTPGGTSATSTEAAQYDEATAVYTPQQRSSSSVHSPIGSPSASTSARSHASPNSSPSLQVRKRRITALQSIHTDNPSVGSSDQWSGFSPLSPLDLDDKESESLPPPPKEDPPEHSSLSSLSDEFLNVDPVKKRAPNIDDQLRAKITSMLTRIPAPIKLVSGPGIPSLEPKQRAISLQPKTARSTRPSTPNLTLTPADSKPTLVRGDKNSGIKLYHLHQEGKDAPIKLHVRLVGEGGERVMVRVGGGWADLEEYLKEYATHHSRRAVSEGQIHVTDFSTPRTSSPMPAQGPSTNASGHTTPSASRPASPSFSLSNFAMRKLRRTSGLSNSPRTPDASTSKTLQGTPGSVESGSGSVRSSSRLSYTEEEAPLGLAGPKSKNAQMSPRKQAWVDGMLNQARKASASAEKKRPDLKDMGKVGSTRRLFRRSTGGGEL